MATHDYNIANQSGAAFRTDLNNALAAIQSNNSNSSAPSDTVAYQWWADTSSGVMKIRNAANDGFIELFQLDGTLTLEDGSNSAPALAFRDDLDTGIYSSAANTFNVATGGTERMELGTVTIFNETGADVDFRIEGDTEANLFYVDAGNNRVGVGTNLPSATFDVVGDIEATISNVSSYQEGLNITNGVNADFNVNIKTNATSIGPSTNTPFSLHVHGHANERMKLATNGQVHIINGDLVLDTNAHGILFDGTSGTGSSLLNDYEEGYWSPTAVDGQALSLQDSGNVPCRRYVKIGRFVTCLFDITWSGSNSSPNFACRFAGLPFSVETGGHQAAAAVTIGFFSGSETDMLVGHIVSGLVKFFENGDALWSYSEGAGDRLAGFVTYTTADL